LQAAVSDDGTPLASILIQGVTLRLDVSRSESIRIDGMRVAETMASILGQNLCFDELHPAFGDDTDTTNKEVAEEKPIQRKRKGSKNNESAIKREVQWLLTLMQSTLVMIGTHHIAAPNLIPPMILMGVVKAPVVPHPGKKILSSPIQ